MLIIANLECKPALLSTFFPIFLHSTKGAFGEFAGFYRLVATRLFFCDQADLKRYSRLKNQSASIDASGSSVFFFVSEHPKKKECGGLEVNKRNQGYPADFEFIEGPLNFVSVCVIFKKKRGAGSVTARRPVPVPSPVL